MKRNPALLLATLLISIGVGCDNNDSPTAPVVDEPDVETVVETFEGTITLGEVSCHAFTAMQSGPAEMKITSLEPLQTLTVGLGLGNDDGDPASACPFFATDRSVRVGETLLTSVVATDSYCVCVFDVGNIFADQTVTYVFDVDHP